MYRTDIFYICKSIVDLPVNILTTSLLVTIPYFAVGLNPSAERFFIALAIMNLANNVTVSMGELTVEKFKIQNNNHCTWEWNCRLFCFLCSSLTSSGIGVSAHAAPAVLFLWWFIYKQRTSAILSGVASLSFVSNVH